MGLFRKLGELFSFAVTEEEIRKHEEEIRKHEEEIREEEEYERSKIPFMNLFTHLDIDDLIKICEKVYGVLPNNEVEVRDKNSSTGYRYEEREMNRRVYENFIFVHIKFDQLKNFVIKNKMISPSHFGDDPKIVGIFNEFENIINIIRRDFKPEKITGEPNLEDQLMIFLKTKFPNVIVERQVTMKNKDRLDIIMDNKYVFELKVPTRRTDLRDLSAQIEEYREHYPNLCVIIADISKLQFDNSDEVEANITQHINDYADQYKVKFGVETLIFNIATRK